MKGEKKNPEKSGFGTGFNPFAMRTEPQKLVSENLKTGHTCRVIGGVKIGGMSVGSRSFYPFPQDNPLSWEGCLSDYVRPKH